MSKKEVIYDGKKYEVIFEDKGSLTITPFAGGWIMDERMQCHGKKYLIDIVNKYRGQECRIVQMSLCKVVHIKKQKRKKLIL